MSVTINYFFNSPESLPELAVQVNDCLGCSLELCQGDLEVYSTSLLGMGFTLAEAKDYENDRELDFENFGFQVSFKTWMGEGAIRPIQLPAMLSVVYALHHFLGITGILVYDMGELLARYEEREVEGYGRHLHDLGSNTSFINYPSHLAVVRQRLPEWMQEF